MVILILLLGRRMSNSGTTLRFRIQTVFPRHGGRVGKEKLKPCVSVILSSSFCLKKILCRSWEMELWGVWWFSAPCFYMWVNIMDQKNVPPSEKSWAAAPHLRMLLHLPLGPLVLLSSWAGHWALTETSGRWLALQGRWNVNVHVALITTISSFPLPLPNVDPASGLGLGSRSLD